MLAVQTERIPLPVHRRGPLQRTGYGLVGFSLVLLLLMGSIPFLNLPEIRFLCLVLAAGGIALVAFHWGLRTYHYQRLKDRTAYCMNCGWYGSGRDVFRFECCPDCDGASSVQLLDR